MFVCNYCICVQQIDKTRYIRELKFSTFVNDNDSIISIQKYQYYGCI